MSTQASGILNHLINDLDPMHDLREAWLATLPFAAEGTGDDDDQGGDGGDDGGDGSSGDGTDTGDGTGDDESGSTADDVKNPRIKELSDEAARHRNATKAEKERADELAKKLKAYEDKDKSKEEKLESDLKEVQARADKAEQALSDANLRISFYESGAAAQLQDPADALKFLDLTELKPDDDGKFKDKDVLSAVEALIKKKPYLAKGKSDDGDGSDGNGDGQASGRRTSGRRTSKDELDRQKLEEKFPALRGR
jgi:hypothetical protein